MTGADREARESRRAWPGASREEAAVRPAADTERGAPPNFLGLFLTPRFVLRTGDDSPARTLRRYVWRMTGWHQLCAALLALAAAGLTLAPLELQRRIVDDAIVAGDLHSLAVLAAVYAAVFAGSLCVKFTLRLYQGWLSESTIRYTRRHLIGIHSDRTRAAGNRHPGEAVSVINTETEKLGGFVGADISQAVSNLAIALGIVGYMIYVEPTVAMAALALVLPQALIAPLLQRRLNRLTRARVSQLRALGRTIAMDVVRVDQGTDARIRRIYLNQIKFFFWKHLMKGALNLLSGLGPIIVLTYGGWMAIQGATTVGVLVAFIAGFDRLASPVRELVTFYRNAEKARVQHEMIAAWMSERTTPDSASAAVLTVAAARANAA